MKQEFYNQFIQFKEKYPERILIFRAGDFYEMYGEDAQEGARILHIALIRSRDDDKFEPDGSKLRYAMFPHPALDHYLPKLIKAGKRVAICDQLEDPKLTKKLVKRGITELVK